MVCNNLFIMELFLNMINNNTDKYSVYQVTPKGYTFLGRQFVCFAILCIKMLIMGKFFI